VAELARDNLIAFGASGALYRGDDIMDKVLMGSRSALFSSTDALHGVGYAHGDDRRSVIPSVLEATLQCRREL
jgi:hypothetical protein